MKSSPYRDRATLITPLVMFSFLLMSFIAFTPTAQAQVGTAEVSTSKQVSTLRAAMESLVDRLRQDINELQGKVADHNNRINQNAANITTNTNSINGLRNDVNYQNNLITQLRSDLNNANTELARVKICNGQGLFYAPDNGARDGNGCVKMQVTATSQYKDCGGSAHGTVTSSTTYIRTGGRGDGYNQTTVRQCNNGTWVTISQTNG